jgi:hypothetical protein
MELHDLTYGADLTQLILGVALVLLWEDPAWKPRQAGFSGRGMIEQVEKAS